MERVYFLDGQHDFLLSSAAGAERSDDFWSAEAGFQDNEDGNESSAEYDSDTFKTPTTKRKRATNVDVLHDHMKNSHNRMDGIMLVTQGFLKSREKTHNLDPIMKCLHELKELREHQSGIESDLNLQPKLKENALAGIAKQKELVLVDKIDSF